MVRVSTVEQNEQDNIVKSTTRQMKELCSMLNLSKDVAYTYKNRLKIEYYKYADIERYINNITSALHTFLST